MSFFSHFFGSKTGNRQDKPILDAISNLNDKPIELQWRGKAEIGTDGSAKKYAVSALLKCRIALKEQKKAQDDFLAWLQETSFGESMLFDLCAKGELTVDRLESCLNASPEFGKYLSGRLATVDNPELLERCGADAVDWNPEVDWSAIPLPWSWLTLSPRKDPASGRLFNPSLQVVPEQHPGAESAEPSDEKGSKRELSTNRSMNAETYERKRNELVQLLNGVASLMRGIEDDYRHLGLDSLAKTREEIESFSRTVFENAFKVVLIAPFQGGKSTTFNAMSGGRCLSPMGDSAISCSATPIEIRHVQDPKEVGAEILMRTDDELEEICEAAGIPCDLSSDEDVDNAISIWNKRFEADRDGTAVLKPEEMNLLGIAGFILTFCRNGQIREYRAKGRLDVAIEDAAMFAKFPLEYVPRLEEKGFKAFSEDESLFAFTRKVSLRVQSPDLAKTGMVLEDCPGLLANAFDTKVTLAELETANAIWFLLGGRMVADSELEIIRKIPATLRKRMIFAANIRSNMGNYLRRVMPQSESALRRSLQGGNVKLHCYNALLALLARQGEDWLRDGRFADASTEAQLKFIAEAMDFDTTDAAEIWRALARHCVFGLHPGGLADFLPISADPLCRKGVDILKRESGWNELVDAVENHVIATRARAILIEDSTQKAIDLVDALCSLLKTRQNDAETHHEELEKRYRKAAKELQEFSDYAHGEVDEALCGIKGNEIDRHLAADIFRTAYIDGAEEIAKTAAPAIARECTLVHLGIDAIVGAGRKFAKWLGLPVAGEPSRTPAAFRCENALKDAVGQVAGRRIGERLFAFANGGDKEFEYAVVRPANRILRDIQEQWERRCEGNELLKGLPVPKPGRAEGGIVARDVIASLKFSSAIGILLRYGLRLTFNQNTLINAIEEGLERDIRHALMAEADSEDATGSIIESVAAMRGQVVANVLAPIKAIETDFQTARDAALHDSEKAEGERKKVAEDCGKIVDRLEHGGRDGGNIKDDLSNFADSVEKLLDSTEVPV